MSYLLKAKQNTKRIDPFMAVPIDYALMQDLSIDIKHMPTAFAGYQYLFLITYDQTKFTIFTPLRSSDAQSVAEA